MEQYSGSGVMMSKEMQSYNNLWEEDNYYGMNTSTISQGEDYYYYYSNGNNTNSKNNPMPMPIIINDQPDAAAAAETAKPKRRRSRGAAAHSTTFLNATISNFRALVQHHTGCRKPSLSPKGPITLCFANANANANANAAGDCTPRNRINNINNQY